MKIVEKSIEVIAIFDNNGNTKPWKFRILNEDGEYSVYFVKVMVSKKDKDSIIYSCESEILGYKNGCSIRCEFNVQSTIGALYFFIDFKVGTF